VKNTKKERLFAKYGSEILKDFDAVLNMDLGISLVDIANKFNFSVQNAHLIFLKLYGISYHSIMKERKFLRKEKIRIQTDIVRNFERNPIRRIKRCKLGSTHHKGTLIEIFVYKKCKDLGYDLSFHHTKSTDVMVNSHKCEIKSSYSSPKGKIPVFHFTIHPNELKNNDFLICHIVNLKQTYIIPMFEIKSENVCISPMSIRSKYHKYLESWYFLEKCQIKLSMRG